mmetsp:Transcript_13918/g.28761  ORF Transcript_13918/g.28761 Transcript_13918/m.28761 type:complete len:241 (+) Transcript_13918:2091-2813(+)
MIHRRERPLDRHVGVSTRASSLVVEIVRQGVAGVGARQVERVECRVLVHIVTGGQRSSQNPAARLRTARGEGHSVEREAGRRDLDGGAGGAENPAVHSFGSLQVGSQCSIGSRLVGIDAVHSRVGASVVQPVGRVRSLQVDGQSACHAMDCNGIRMALISIVERPRLDVAHGKTSAITISAVAPRHVAVARRAFARVVGDAISVDVAGRGVATFKRSNGGGESYKGSQDRQQPHSLLAWR